MNRALGSWAEYHSLARCFESMYIKKILVRSYACTAVARMRLPSMRDGAKVANDTTSW
jgi:hypothetical protein